MSICDHEFKQKIHTLDKLTQEILVSFEDATHNHLPNLRIYEFITLCSAASLNLVNQRQILRKIKNIT